MVHPGLSRPGWESRARTRGPGPKGPDPRPRTQGRPGYPVAVPDLDLLDLLSADHQNLVSAEAGSLVRVVLEHVTVERDLLHPAIEEYEPGGKAIVEGQRDADRMLEERLAAFEHDHSPDREMDVRKVVTEHIERQEPLFEQLRLSCPEDTLLKLVDGVNTSIAGAPKHPHPGLLRHGRFGEVVEEFADIADEIRDKLHGDRS
jgi:hypothetical protein